MAKKTINIFIVIISFFFSCSNRNLIIPTTEGEALKISKIKEGDLLKITLLNGKIVNGLIKDIKMDSLILEIVAMKQKPLEKNMFDITRPKIHLATREIASCRRLDFNKTEFYLKYHLKPRCAVSIFLVGGDKIEGTIILTRDDGLILNTKGREKIVYIKWAEISQITVIGEKSNPSTILQIIPVVLTIVIFLFIVVQLSPPIVFH